MSLDKISLVISNAFKSASAVNTGSPDEKFALDALGGLAGLVEARAKQGAHLNAPSSATSASAQKLKSFASIPTPAATPAAGAGGKAGAPQVGGKPGPQGDDDSYDLK